MTNMRKIIAQRMIESRRTSAHVHCMYEVDFTRIVNLRNKHKAGFEQRHGVRLTYMPFFVRAAIIALQQWPIVNASIEGENIRYHRQINVGIAVALDWGLIVPVLKNAGDLNFLGLQRGITKMPLVVTDKDGNDSIAIRSVVHLTLGYDHRIIDGAVADQFMAFVKKTLEGWGEDVG